MDTNNRHFWIAGASAALAILLRKTPALRLAFGAVSAVELTNALMASKAVSSLRAVQDREHQEAAPQLVQSALVNNIVMRWEEHGDKSEMSIPIIMVHGIPTHPRLWRYVIPKLIHSSVHIFAWEMVGYGWSMKAGLNRDISVKQQADYLYEWMQHQKIREAIFVGHDLGGGVIQQFMVKYPEYCLGVVLADCVAYDNWPIAPVRLAQSMTQVIKKLPSFLLKPFFLASLFNLGHDNQYQRISSAEIHWQPYGSGIGPRAFAHQLESLHTDDTMEVSDQLKQLNIPAQIIWAENDPLNLSSAEKLAEDLKAPLIMIPGARHFTPEDHPDIIAHAVREVLNTVSVTV